MYADMQKIIFPYYEAKVPHFYLASITHIGDGGLMETRIQTLLAHIQGLSTIRKTFFTHIVMLFLSLRGRFNFLNMARFGTYSEKTYRTHFEQPFAFWDFNTALVQQICSPHRIIAGDCTYLPKSGKQPPHVGTFWNGCVGKAMPGLELSSLAVVDVNHHTAFHLLCQQTPADLTDAESRIDFYVT